MSDPNHRVRPAEITPQFVAANFRGVAMAAYAPLGTIMRILQCSEEEAIRFQAWARNDIDMVLDAVAQAKQRMCGTKS